MWENSMKTIRTFIMLDFGVTGVTYFHRKSSEFRFERYFDASLAYGLHLGLRILDASKLAQDWMKAQLIDRY